jgi:hypothetical protein
VQTDGYCGGSSTSDQQQQQQQQQQKQPPPQRRKRASSSGGGGLAAEGWKPAWIQQGAPLKQAPLLLRPTLWLARLLLEWALPLLLTGRVKGWAALLPILLGAMLQGTHLVLYWVRSWF